MKGNNVLGLIYADAHSVCIDQLTALRTMGSVPFGGRYRLIDFPLSNMVNCGIRKVGVITKSNYQSLMDHIGNGKPWDLSRKNEGLFILPPFTNGNGIYTCRIDALANIMPFIKKSKEEYVVLSDCNFICNIDIGRIVDKHIASGADITFAYKEGRIPALEDIMVFDVDSEGFISDVTVPVNPDGEGRYSINIIVMRKSLLERLVNEAVTRGYTSFEKDIIRQNVHSLKMNGCLIDGFCPAVDSLKSYFDANMALLKEDNLKQLFHNGDPVYTKTADDMPAVYGIGASVNNSLIADGCRIEGTVENSVIFRGVHIEKGAVVRNSIIMHSSFIGADSKLDWVIMDKYGVVRPRNSLSGAETYPVYIGKSIII